LSGEVNDRRSRRRSGGEGVAELEAELDVRNLRRPEHIIVDGGPDMTTSFHGALNLPAVSLHRVCPRDPDRPHDLDTVRKVQKGVNCEGTGCETRGVVLIVQSAEVVSRYS
jgi:hypothetical protein